MKIYKENLILLVLGAISILLLLFEINHFITAIALLAWGGTGAYIHLNPPQKSQNSVKSDQD